MERLDQNLVLVMKRLCDAEQEADAHLRRALEASWRAHRLRERFRAEFGTALKGGD